MQVSYCAAASKGQLVPKLYLLPGTHKQFNISLFPLIPFLLPFTSSFFLDLSLLRTDLFKARHGPLTHNIRFLHTRYAFLQVLSK